MCTYAVARFSCRHELWGRRTKLCTIGEDFRDGHITSDCTLRGTHPLKTMTVPEPCYNCFKLKALPMLCRAKLQEARSVFKERWPEEIPPKQASTIATDNTAIKAQSPGTKGEKVGFSFAADVKEHIVDAPNDASQIGKPKTPRKLVKPTPIAKIKSKITPPRKSGLLTAKTNPPSKEIVAPAAPKPAPSKISPPRPRLGLSTTKAPEKKQLTSAESSPQAKAKLGSKLPKPGFLRK